MVNVAEITTANIELSVIGSGKVTVTQGTIIDYTTSTKIVILQIGVQAELLFEPAKGYKFTGWEGLEDSSTQNPVLVNILGDGAIAVKSEKTSTDIFSDIMEWFQENPMASVAVVSSVAAIAIFGGGGGNK